MIIGFQRMSGLNGGIIIFLENKFDVELRRRAFMVLQHICGPGPVFDPFAPEGQRRQQAAILRQQLARLPQAS